MLKWWRKRTAQGNRRQCAPLSLVCREARFQCIVGTVGLMYCGHLLKSNRPRSLPPPKFAPRSGSWDGTLRLWEIQSGRTTRRFVGHSKDVLSVAFSADNRQIVSGSRDKTIKLWNTLGECKYTIQEDVSDTIVCLLVTNISFIHPSCLLSFVVALVCERRLCRTSGQGHLASRLRMCHAMFHTFPTRPTHT